MSLQFLVTVSAPHSSTMWESSLNKIIYGIQACIRMSVVLSVMTKCIGFEEHITQNSCHHYWHSVVTYNQQRMAQGHLTVPCIIFITFVLLLLLLIKNKQTQIKKLTDHCPDDG
jgi:hypothetical protein